MEKRTHPRLDSDIRARILINKTKSATASVLNLSASGLRFGYDDPIELGDEVVAHLEGGSRLVGRVVRKFDSGFAISLMLSEDKLRRLARSLEKARAASETMSRLTLDRRFSVRVAHMQRKVVCETADKKIDAEIVDMSLTGVAIKTDAVLDLDSLICVGRMRGYVVRREGNIYGIRFLSAEGAHAELVAQTGPAAQSAKLRQRV